MIKRLQLFTLVVCCFVYPRLCAQICSGTSTTVWKDDFGTGIDQLSPSGSPNINSTGYMYASYGVGEGNYAIVNKFDYYSNWHTIPEDHTPGDTNGYFLVIDGNTSFPVFYETIINGVCPFTQFSFSTAAMNTDQPVFPSDQTFTFIISDTLGNLITSWTSPPVPATDTPVWVPLGFNFNSGNHTALKFQVSFTNTGFNDFAFDDFAFSVCGPTLTINTTASSNTCIDSIPLTAALGSGYANPVYQWQKKNNAGIFVDIAGAIGANYTDHNLSDTNEYRLLVGDGSLSCPINNSKQIIVKAKKRTSIQKNICSGDSFEGYNSTGTYIDTFSVANGCDSIRTLSLIVNNCVTSLGCNNWLKVPHALSGVSAGDLDIAGDQLTIEAICYGTDIYDSSRALVSKHKDPGDVNYFLCPDLAQITTTTGFYSIASPCSFISNKMYHVAMVYNGSSLKLYRNGFLMNETAASGNLILNDWPVSIGEYSYSRVINNAAISNVFKGFLNEVRIWNTARTQSELQTYMNSPLPSPSTQTGLLAYYSFDNLLNKQGNSTYNAVISGTSTINTTVPYCPFTADSCDYRPTQACSGSFGNPVVNITFGSGANNPGPQLSTAVPGATTNYSFASGATGNPPAVILDGSYALINGVPVNSAWYTGAPDHTGDPNGYMAFFNASPTPGEFYRQTVANLCPGTTYEFGAWVANVLNPAILPGAILPNITFKILDPVTQAVLATYNSGDVPMSSNAMTWRQYSFLFVMPSTNNSVTLVLANNNIGGIQQPGNDLAIDDITFRPCGPLTNISFSNSSQVDSTATTDCSTVNVYGTITGSFNAPAYKWQISSDGGNSFNDIAGANTLSTTLSNIAAGSYIIRMLSAESANINSLNCSFISNEIKLTVTSCTSNGRSVILNSYAAVSYINPCTNEYTVDDVAGFKTGDTVMVMQMKGASIDSLNSSNYGNISNYNNAGYFEINYVKSVIANRIELLNQSNRTFDYARGKVQLVRVPYFQTITITDTVTCLPWNGSKGGVVIINSATDINMDGPIDVSGKGFRGGQIGSGFSCNNTTQWAAPAGLGGNKGEGITEYILNQEAGGAKLANGGGAAYSANTGGGGGANYGAGGVGGEQSNSCPSQTQSPGGQALDYSNTSRVFMGGGGGGGQQDDGQPVAPGGSGGGIVILKCFTLNGNAQPILANGESVTTLVRDEGGAGGGAGGSILLYVNGYSGSVDMQANGGDGSSNENQVYPSRCHGPGGGGGGGYIGYLFGPVPPGVTASANGGRAGLVLNNSAPCFNTTYGAADGDPGGGNFGLAWNETSIRFNRNIDSVRIKDSAASCNSFNFRGIAYVKNIPVQSWYWTFGDGDNANVQSTSHTYTSGGSYTVKLVITDQNGCKDSTEKVIQVGGGINSDFVFEEEACTPLSVQFKAIGDTTSLIYWSLGDGTIINTIRNPVHIYTDSGYYVVKYSTGGSCADTVTKRIYIGVRPGNIIVTPDTAICNGSGLSILIRSNFDSTRTFCWSPTTYLNNSSLANPTTTPPTTISYILQATASATNLVTNPDFTAGNSGFTSDYTGSTAPLSPGQFTVANSSLNAGTGTATCFDHTNGVNGNMMIVNTGAAAAKTWKQSVAVNPNINYIFSVWIQSLKQPNNALVQLLINDMVAKDSIVVSGNTCEWKKYSVLWNSGNRTTANLSAGVRTSAAGNNFFALDDISFSVYEIQKETVKIGVDTLRLSVRNDTTVCQSVPVILTASGAATYQWTPVAGLSNPSIASPAATPDTTTKYYIKGTSTNGCTGFDSVTITIKPKPVIQLTNDTIICRNTSIQLNASGGISYAWTPASTLSNASIPNPVASPAATTTYKVTVTGNNNCVATDSVKVDVKNIPVFTVNPAQSVCTGSIAQLSAAGGNFYQWSPASLVSNPSISNPLAISDTSATYTVLIRDTTCNDQTLLSTRITVLPVPAVTANKSNDITCAVSSATLTAAGAAQYSWSPATALSSTSGSSTIASPQQTTMYTVTGRDVNGCTDTAQVQVVADKSRKLIYYIPNAFTPNGDGLNDCFSVSFQNPVSELLLNIYNRYGELVYTATKTSDCWNGMVKGKPAVMGNYVYYLQVKTDCARFEKKGNVLLIR